VQVVQFAKTMRARARMITNDVPLLRAALVVCRNDARAAFWRIRLPASTRAAHLTPSAMMEVMRPGHPWETNELDELRARQRQQLRAVPRRLLADLNVVSPVIRHDEDRGLVEMEFRRRARDWAEKDPAKKTLERLEALLPAVVLSAMVSATQIDEEVLGPDLGVLAKEKPDDEGVVTDAGAQAALRAFGAWAAMADQVAGDYSDPRLRGSAPRADK
jgi:hypothetical protein